ncbi:septin-8-B-like [Thunnus thynnus]|uniref:septin-8-B-like n=1 Tax=Thunnus thynnus TaxID=8237 RepID=UPI0035273C30
MATSKKYQDIISKDSQISSGSPDVHQLRPKEEKFGTLTRKTVGEKNLNKTNKTILLVGETGAGKSTLINTLFNYTMGVKFDDDIWFEIVEREKKSQSESQTSDVIVYEIFGFEDITLPFSLTIIDTPGFGDTGEIKHDVISQRLLDLFRSEDGVDEIDAVGLVMKASVNRLSDRLRYIFDSVTSLFGKDIEKNIVALMTHSDGIIPEDALTALEAANIKCAKDEENQPVHFLFNNRQNKQRTKKTKDALESAWNVTETGAEEFKDFLEKSKPQKLITTVEVMNARIRITACINNLQDRIQLIELKQNEIQQTEEALKKHEQEMKKNEEFTVDVDEVYKEKEPLDGGMWGWVFYEAAVTCNTCEENCHYPGCTMAWSPRDCEVMKDGRCTACTGKCPAEDHVKENWRYVNKTRRVKKTERLVTQKYEKNKVDHEQKMSLLENLQTEMEKLKAEKIQLLDEVYLHVEHLDRIALNVDSLSTYVHLDYLIEKMNERGKEKVQKLKEMAGRVDERTRTTMWYMYGALTAAGKAVKDALM